MASPISGFQLTTSVLGLIGNLSSAIGAYLIVICYVFLLPLNTHFRHRMILNLAIADAMNNTIGSFNQIYLLSTGHHPGGTACSIIGIIVQLSVQAIDVSIFGIAMVTVIAIIRPRSFDEWSHRKATLIVASLWVLPVITSFFAYAKNLYTPASGGWCWINPTPVYYRYVLTHGWRFIFIFVIMVSYTYLYFHLKNHYKELMSASGGGQDSHTSSFIRRKMSTVSVKLRGRLRSNSVGPPVPPKDHIDEYDDRNALCLTSMAKKPSTGGVHTGNLPPSPVYPGQESLPTLQIHDSQHAQKTTFATTSATSSNPKFDTSAEHAERLQKIRKVLLMRAYPTWYVILWIPGLANRLVEATGHVSPKWLVILQSGTSYIGFANAVTYGWNEGILRELRRKMDQYRRRARGEGAVKWNSNYV